MERGLWQSVIGEIELSVPHASFEAMFKKTNLVSVNENNICISVPNVFIEAQLKKRYADLIKSVFEKNGVKNPKITYRVSLKNTTAEKSSNKKTTPTEESISIAEIPKQNEEIVSMPNVNKTGLNPRYNFDNFIVGSSNDFAYSACRAISANPGSKYNPLFLYSGVGLGKTHLVQAVGNEITKQNPNLKVLYTTSEAFTREFLDSIRFKKQDFSNKYRDVDVLIVDDMQFIANKEKTQEEFFHTFNALHQKNKQIIITSDKPPKSIPTLTERLRSRFEWGMTIDIQMPDFETRCAILEAKAELSNVTLDRSTTEYLANNFRTNIRELEGALNQLLAYSEMRGIQPSIETAEGLLENTKSTRPRHLTAKQIIQKTSQYFQIPVEEVCGSCRAKHIVTARQIAMYLLRSELHLSFPKVSIELGRKDHTTAIHSIDKIEKEIKLNARIREQVNDIRETLYS